MTQIYSTARLETAHGSRYLQQLCKHWSHNFTVSFTPDEGSVIFPRDALGADLPEDATLRLTADETGLECRLDAGSADQLTALKGAVERHLDRFAFRESPLHFDWADR